LKGEFNKQNFFKSLGIDKDSKLYFIFNDIYNLVKNNCENIFDYIKDEDFENLDTYLETYCNKKTSAIIKKLIKENRTVYIGQFNDFEPPIGVYLCKTSFNICDDNIFFSSPDASY
jgi:hypothetical protein